MSQVHGRSEIRRDLAPCTCSALLQSISGKRYEPEQSFPEHILPKCSSDVGTVMTTTLGASAVAGECCLQSMADSTYGTVWLHAHVCPSAVNLRKVDRPSSNDRVPHELKERFKASARPTHFRCWNSQDHFGGLYSSWSVLSPARDRRDIRYRLAPCTCSAPAWSIPGERYDRHSHLPGSPQHISSSKGHGHRDRANQHLDTRRVETVCIR